MATLNGEVKIPAKDLAAHAVLNVTVYGIASWYRFRIIPALWLIRLACKFAGCGCEIRADVKVPPYDS